MRGEPGDSRPRRQAGLLFVGVAAIVAAVFAEACFGLFLLYDDPMIVTENPALRGGLADALRWAFLDDMGGNWVPVAALTHVADVALFGFDPFFHHLTSVLFHAAAAGAFAVFLLRVTGSISASALGALLWAVHPLRVESVAWVSERRDVVSGLFLMLLLLAWERWARTGERRQYRLALAWSLAALLSKPTMVTLPALLLIVDVWPLRRHHHEVGWRALLVEKIPVLLFAALIAAATLFLQDRGGAVSSLAAVGTGPRLANAVVSLGRYAGKTFWPVDLVVPYGVAQDGWPVSVVAGVGAGIVAALVVGGVLARRGRVELLAALLWFGGALLPVLGVVHVGVAAMANRYTYLAHVLPAVAVAALLAPPPVRSTRTVSVVVLVAVVLLAVATVRDVPVWHDTKRLFTRTVEVEPTNSVAWHELAIEAVYAGRMRDAVEPARKSVQFRPVSSSHYDVLVLVLDTTGDHQGAVEAAVDWLTADPTNAAAHARLAISLFALGDVTSARSEAQKARMGAPLPPPLAADLARAEVRATQGAPR